MNELISIIIPTHNRPEWLFEAVNSSLAQSYDSVEVIVVDDGSEPNINQPVIQKFPQIKYIYQKNSGLGAARNTGLAASQGRFIQFLDDDDWLSTDAVREKLAELAFNRDTGVVYSDLYLTDVNGKITSKYFERFKRPLPSGDLYAILVKRNFIPAHAILWKRDLLENIGGFPPRSGHEDWECVVRAAEYTNFSVIDKPLGYYRQHGKNMTHAFDVMYRGKLEFQPYIVSSERFGQLPSAQRIMLLTRFALQQWAFGDWQTSVQFLHAARRENPVAILPVLLRMGMLLGRPFARLLVKGRARVWRMSNK